MTRLGTTEQVWESLDPSGPPRLEWLRGVRGRPVLLLGAFDPPTLAHVALATGAARETGQQGAFCLTKVLLDRTGPALLAPPRRLDLLLRLGAEHGLGVAVSNRGTYLDVARATGERPAFVIGSDKIAQLRDPRFYPDGAAGVAATFEAADFLVVPRAGVPVPPGMRALDPGRVFPSPHTASISASQVRERLATGAEVADLVPPVVADTLRGYTGVAERR